MEAIDHYRQAIRNIIIEYADYGRPDGDIEVETIFDESKDHYELHYSGWNGPRRIHGAVLHLDIRNGKIWIQHDGQRPEQRS